MSNHEKYSLKTVHLDKELTERYQQVAKSNGMIAARLMERVLKQALPGLEGRKSTSAA